MCRLLCWATTSPKTLGEVLGEPGLSKFIELSRLHNDGWGSAGVEPTGSAPQVSRSTSPAHSDELLDTSVGAPYSGCVVHFRKASPGLAVEMRNTHPFIFESVAFAHNGSIDPQERLDELLAPRWRERMVGTTDSERYFLAVMAEVEGGRELSEAIDVVVTRITREFETSSLNAMFITPSTIYVVNSHDPDKSPGPYMEPDGKPYYQLRLRRTVDTVVVASSGFPQSDDEGWEMLDNHTLLTIDLVSATTSVASLGSRDIVASR
ncbi:MAG TPA: class II glutamine amidotransferase [Acidimicrobiales bacterium]